MARFDGKVVLVTGASRGIGESIARRFASEGARVALSSRKLENLEPVAASMAEAGAEVMAHPAHNGRVPQLMELVDAVEARLGPIDVLVNNAGTNPVFAPILNADERLWDALLSINLKGAFFLSQRVAPSMAERGGGAIVNVSSIGGVTPMPGLGVYGITKAALNMLTITTAAEWGPMGIRVNAVLPGVIDTRFASVLVNTPSIRDPMVAQTPLRRLGQPEDVSGVVAFLASDDARHITGHLTVVDGGLLGR